MTVDKNRCPANHRCPSVRVCPVGAIIQEGTGLPRIDMSKCTQCGKCVRFCPMGAIHK